MTEPKSPPMSRAARIGFAAGIVVAAALAGWLLFHKSVEWSGWIANADKKDEHRKLVVGVNEFVTDDQGLSIATLRIGEEADQEQRAKLAALRARRDNDLVTTRLDALRAAARTEANVVPFILDCARAYCTLFEIRAALEDVFGAYREPVFF